MDYKKILGGSFILPLVLIFTISCQFTRKASEVKLLEFQFIKNIEFQKTLTMASTLTYPQIIHQKEDTFFIYTDIGSSVIYKYNFSNKQLIDSININNKNDFLNLTKSKKRKFIIDFVEYINDDSIFIRFHLLYFNLKEKADSTLMLINWNGEIKNIYSLKGVPVPSSENLSLPKDSASYFASNTGNNAFDRKSKKLIILMQRWINTVPGDELFETKRISTGGHLNLVSPNCEYIDHNILYPKVISKGYYPRIAQKPYFVIGHNGNIFYGFSYTNLVAEFNLNSNKIVSWHRFGSSIFDSIPPTNIPYENNPKMKYPKNFPSNDPALANYQAIYYDPFRFNYYRIVRQPNPQINANPIYTFTVADTQFKIIAEGIIPNDFHKKGWLPPLFRSEGIYFINHIENDINLDKITLTLFKPTITSHSIKNKILSTYKENNPQNDVQLEKVLLNFFPDRNSQAILIIPIEQSCHTCLDKISKYLKDSSNIYLKNNINIILVSGSMNNMRNYIIKYNLKEIEPFFKKDVKGIIFKSIKDQVNPRWIIFKEGIIQSDIILNPEEIPLFHRKIRDFLDNQQN